MTELLRDVSAARARSRRWWPPLRGGRGAHGFGHVGQQQVGVAPRSTSTGISGCPGGHGRACSVGDDIAAPWPGRSAGRRGRRAGGACWSRPGGATAVAEPTERACTRCGVCFQVAHGGERCRVAGIAADALDGGARRQLGADVVERQAADAPAQPARRAVQAHGTAHRGARSQRHCAMPSVPSAIRPAGRASPGSTRRRAPGSNIAEQGCGRWRPGRSRGALRATGAGDVVHVAAGAGHACATDDDRPG